MARTKQTERKFKTDPRTVSAVEVGKNIHSFDSFRERSTVKPPRLVKYRGLLFRQDAVSSAHQC